MIKLIFSDMDGTLLNERGELPPDFDEVMQALQRKNVLFAPASGRQYYTLLHQFSAYKDAFVFLAENGTYAAYRGEELFASALPPAVVTEMLAIAEQIPETHTVLCGKQSAYIKPGATLFEKEVEKYYVRCQVVDDFAAVRDDILKIAVCDLSASGAEDNTYRHFSAFKDRLQITVSSHLWMDIMNPGVNKGTAAQYVQKMLGILPEECMAFGDYLNDIELLRAAHHSYAMENAHPRLRETARFGAKSNRENGVMQAIRTAVLNAE